MIASQRICLLFVSLIAHALFATPTIAETVYVRVTVCNAAGEQLKGVALEAHSGGPAARGITGPGGSSVLEINPPEGCSRVLVGISDAFGWPTKNEEETWRLQVEMQFLIGTHLFPRARWVELEPGEDEYSLVLKAYESVLVSGEFLGPDGIAPNATITAPGLVLPWDIPDPGSDSFAGVRIPRGMDQVLLVHHQFHHHAFAQYLSAADSMHDFDLGALQVEEAQELGRVNLSVSSVEEWYGRYNSLYQQGLTLISTQVASDHTVYDLVAGRHDGNWRVIDWQGEARPLVVRAGEYFVLPGRLMRTGAQDRALRSLMGPEKAAPPVPIVRVVPGETLTASFDLIELDDALRAAGYYAADSDF